MPRIGGSKIGGAHGWTHETTGPDEISIASLAGISAELASHAADLDAHTYNLWQLTRKGEYLLMGPASTTQLVVANTLYAIPFIVARAMSVDRIAIKVYGAGAGGTKARLGIYGPGVDLYPGALVVDAGTVDVDATGTKTIVIDKTLAKGINWLALVSDGTPELYAIVHSANHSPVLGYADGRDHNSGWTGAFTYAALPDPFPAGYTIQTVSAFGISLRVFDYV